MQQTKLRLSKKARQLVDEFRTKGLHRAREVNRAHILSALDHGTSEAQIMDMIGVTRSVIWRTRSAYLEGGVEYALLDAPRSGKPRQYGTDAEAALSALACSSPPKGAKRWTLALLTAQANTQADLAAISRETIRRLLKKTASSPGAS